MPSTRQLAEWTSRFAPPIALMGVIFFLSAQPNLRTELGTIDLIGRKIVHMVEFGLLFALWLRALGWSGRAAWWAAGIAIAYAVSDEFHQTFVDGRQGSPRDVAIDSAGVAIAALIAWRLRVRRRILA